MDAENVVDFQVVRGLEGLKSLEARWRELTSRLANRRFFHEYDWFRSHLESQAVKPEPIFVMASTPDGTPAAIFPLQHVSVRKKGIELSSLQIFGPPDMEIHDFIIDKSGIGDNLIHLLIRQLSQQHRLCFDLLNLQNVPEESAITEAIVADPRPLTVSQYRHSSKYIALGKTYEETTSGVSGKFKRNLRRQLRKLEKFGRVNYATYADIVDLEKAYEMFLGVEASSWRGSKGTGTALILHEQQSTFYRELVTRFARTNQSRIDIMTVSGKPVAAQLGIISGDTLNLLKIAYDESYKDMGPGGLLLNKTLERYSGHVHINHISFVTGARWNDAWAPLAKRVYNHVLFQLTPASLCMYSVECFKDFLTDTVSPLTTRKKAI